jgi:hypothetical protein
MGLDEERLAMEREKLEFEHHKNRRDEQFWFTAAAVGFSGLLLVRAEVPALFAVLAVALVSLFATYLVLTRWLAAASRLPPDEPHPTKASAFERFRYTCRLIGASLQSIPWVVAELSGTAFYVFLILMSFVGVVWKYWHGLFG